MDATLSVLTLVHVVISLIAMGAGFILLGGLLEGRSGIVPARVFLGTTALTSATGFLFPINGFTPALGVGIVALGVLAPTAYALFARQLAGRWRSVYVLGSVVLVYLNVFVLVAQLFLKVPAMHELAPTQREMPFVVVQLGVLATFVSLGVRANARLRSLAAGTAH